MPFIEIAPGESIRVSLIEKVENAGGKTIIRTANNRYITTIPYEEVLKIISNKEGDLLENLNGILKRMGSFAG